MHGVLPLRSRISCKSSIVRYHPTVFILYESIGGGLGSISKIKTVRSQVDWTCSKAQRSGYSTSFVDYILDLREKIQPHLEDRK